VIAVAAFHYERVVRPAGAGVVAVVPDGPMWGHARPGFGDVRVVDANGNEVPWRERLDFPIGIERVLKVLDSGRRGRFAVVRIRTPAPVDRITLEIPDRSFVGVATVFGDGTKIASEQIYSVHGASSARSTTVLLPPNDFHVLDIRATHVTRIAGVTVGVKPAASDLAPLPARTHVAGSTVVVDLGHANVPVDELRVSSTTPRYDRSFTVTARNGFVTSGRLVRRDGPSLTVVPVSAAGRFLRITIANGNDPPLRDLRVTAYARPRELLVEGGHAAPLTLYYGAAVAAPEYDFVRLPLQGTPRVGALGPERPNPHFRVVDRRSFFSKHRSLVSVALALAAALLVAAGALALRRT
jgi:hypothetical protein